MKFGKKLKCLYDKFKNKNNKKNYTLLVNFLDKSNRKLVNKFDGKIISYVNILTDEQGCVIYNNKSKNNTFENYIRGKIMFNDLNEVKIINKTEKNYAYWNKEYKDDKIKITFALKIGSTYYSSLESLPQYEQIIIAILVTLVILTIIYYFFFSGEIVIDSELKGTIDVITNSGDDTVTIYNSKNDETIVLHPSTNENDYAELILSTVESSKTNNIRYIVIGKENITTIFNKEDITQVLEYLVSKY